MKHSHYGFCQFLISSIVSCCVLATPSVHAKPDLSLPKGCYQQGFVFEDNTLTLLPPKAGNTDSVYFIYNHSPTTLNLYELQQAKNHLGINANNKIAPYEWGVYSSDQTKVRFACTIPDKTYAHGKLVDCQQKLNVCEYTHVKYGVNNRGNYWMARSASKNAAIKRAIYIGVLLSNK